MRDVLDYFSSRREACLSQREKLAGQKNCLFSNVVKSVVITFIWPMSFVPLWSAAAYGDVSKVEALLADGVDVEAKDQYGVNPLIHAATNGHAAVVQTLVERGQCERRQQRREWARCDS